MVAGKSTGSVTRSVGDQRAYGWRLAVPLIEAEAELGQQVAPREQFDPAVATQASTAISAAAAHSNSCSPSKTAASPAAASAQAPAGAAAGRRMTPARRPPAVPWPQPGPPTCSTTPVEHAPPHPPPSRYGCLSGYLAPAVRASRHHADCDATGSCQWIATSSCQWSRQVVVSARGVRHGGRLSDRPRPNGLGPRAYGSKEPHLAHLSQHPGGVDHVEHSRAFTPRPFAPIVTAWSQRPRAECH
jgi:hypothetical protein